MHAEKCILGGICKLANSDECTNRCPHFIVNHGSTGRGGRVGAAKIPSNYLNINLKNSPAKLSQKEIYNKLEPYVKTFGRYFESDQKQIKSLFLYSSSPGTGKTTTAAALISEWLTAYYVGCLTRSLSPMQQPAYMLDVNAWQTLFNEFNRSNIPADIGEEASRQYYRQMQSAKTAPFAVLDDIGVRNATEAFRGDLHAVINARVTNGLPTVYTSNLPLAEMERVFDARLYDRMRDQCAELVFVGKSKRGMRK